MESLVVTLLTIACQHCTTLHHITLHYTTLHTHRAEPILQMLRYLYSLVPVTIIQSNIYQLTYMIQLSSESTPIKLWMPLLLLDKVVTRVNNMASAHHIFNLCLFQQEFIMYFIYIGNINELLVSGCFDFILAHLPGL